MFTAVHIDLGDVDKGLDAMTRRSVIATALKDLKVPMRLDQRDHAKAKSGPDGSWAPRAASTLASRARAKRKLPAKLLGRLPTAVGYKATLGEVIAESRVAWSAIHQDGGTAGRGARIPARPFLWISDKLMITAEEILTWHILTAFGGV